MLNDASAAQLSYTEANGRTVLMEIALKKNWPKAVKTSDKACSSANNDGADSQLPSNLGEELYTFLETKLK